MNLSELIDQIRGILAEDGDKTPAAQGRERRGVARAQQVAWDAHNRVAVHGREYATAREHTKQAEIHAKAGNFKKSYQHAAAASDAHARAAKAAGEMGDHELASKHRDLSVHILAHGPHHGIKKPAGKK